MSKAGKDDIEQQADLLRRHLLQQVTDKRQALGLDKKELAERCGVDRMTVGRAEGEDSKVSFQSFLLMSLGLGLTPALLETASGGIEPHSDNLVHRGYSHARTKSNLDWEDRLREVALATAWEHANARDQVAWSPVVDTLVPHCTQEQASAMATVIQWLGSEVGFEFLKNALGTAGYSIEKTQEVRWIRR